MDIDAAAVVRRVLDQAAALLPAPILWRSNDHVVLSRVLEQRHYFHCNPFCMAVKGPGGAWDRCKVREGPDLLADIERLGRPFTKTCHAGVVEHVIPLFHQGRCRGSIIYGPFRSRDKPCPYPTCRPLHRALPLFSEREVHRALPLLELIGRFIVLVYTQPDGHAERATRDQRVLKAARYLSDHLGESVRVTEVARHCGLSASRLLHLFKRETGQTLRRYLIGLRVEGAAKRLAFSQQPLAAIASELGFTDQSHFGAVFRRHAGQTPRGYRLRMRDETPGSDGALHRENRPAAG